jgi:hypothetical protein
MHWPPGKPTVMLVHAVFADGSSWPASSTYLVTWTARLGS